MRYQFGHGHYLECTSSKVVRPDTVSYQMGTELATVADAVGLLDPRRDYDSDPLVFLDAGVGSGPVAAGWMVEWSRRQRLTGTNRLPPAQILAFDKNRLAVETATVNLMRLAGELSLQAVYINCFEGNWHSGELWQQLHHCAPNGIDAIGANPPYLMPDDDIRETGYEDAPHDALYTSSDRLEHFRHLWPGFLSMLRNTPGAAIIMRQSSRADFESESIRDRALRDYCGEPIKIITTSTLHHAGEGKLSRLDRVCVAGNGQFSIPVHQDPQVMLTALFQ